MSLIGNPELRDVTGITDAQKAAIKAFMQGAVYSWCKHRGSDWFAVRDLVGGDDFDWQGTPLIALYEKHVAQGKTGAAAVECAGKDLGWLVKSMLAEDRRTFEPSRGGLVSIYRWVPATSAGVADEA